MEEEFQKQFQAELVQALGRAQLETIGQGVRLRMLAQQLALTQHELEAGKPTETKIVESEK